MSSEPEGLEMVDDQQVKAWEASGDLAERIATEIVKWGRRNGAWTNVPYGTAFIRFPFEASEFDAAQRLLARHGFLIREGDDYFIAPNAPGRAPA
jgi:histidinol-phosphate/aromatic aminotransferase/cobyric acid decarboxylase-like protein